MSASNYTDLQILTMLEMQSEGQTCRDIAWRFGTTKNAIVGLMHRVKAQADKHDPDGNQNGTMPRQWWKK